MKLNYSKQLTVCFGIIILFNILTTVFKHWIFHSIGFCLTGLIWIINPVMIHDKTPSKKEKLLLRLSGVALILIGIFSRAYYY